MVNISILEKTKKVRKISVYPIKAKLPTTMMIEITNACNLKCEMCYNKSMKRKKNFISTGLFKRIVDEAVRIGITDLALYTTGESFLHPNIFEFIRYSKEKGIPYVYITTNGQAINKDGIQKIIDSGLDSIKFSIDAGVKERYEGLRKGASWERLIKTIKSLRYARDTSKSKLRIFASFMVTNDNYDDLLSYHSTFSNYIDETNFSVVSNQGSQVNVSSLYPRQMNLLISKVYMPREKWHPCSLLWNRIHVTSEGKLSLCCIDFDNNLIYGDITKHSIKECWNNQKMIDYRKKHKKLDFKGIPMCGECHYIKADPEISKMINNECKYITHSVGR